MITSGLKAGDKVVIDGVDRLRDGAKVKVVDKRRGSAAAQGAARRGRTSKGAAAAAAGVRPAARGQHQSPPPRPVRRPGRAPPGHAGELLDRSAPASASQAPRTGANAARPRAARGAATQGAAQ